MDQLTGLPARADLGPRLEAMLHASAAISGILLDIDGFVWVNDQRGHVEGDAVLVQLATWLTARSRELGGEAFRVAGDEFLVALPDCVEVDALALAHSLLAECAALGIPYASPGQDRDSLSLSAVVFAIDASTAEQIMDILDRAETRRYEAEKAEGRNFGIVTLLR